MRRSLILPGALALLMLVLVVSGQVGVDWDAWWQTSARASQALQHACWALLVLGAWALWFRVRERGALLYALALSVSTVSWVASLTGHWLVAPWIYPFQLGGLALAAVAWAEVRTPAREPVISWLMISTGAVAVLSWGYMLTLNLHGATVYAAALLTGLQSIYWITLAAASWRWYAQQGVRPLKWLAAQGAFTALNVLVSVGWMLRWALMPAYASLVVAVLQFLPMGMVGMVIWSGWVRERA